MRSESWPAFIFLPLLVVLELHSGIGELIIRLADAVVGVLIFPRLVAPNSAEKSAYLTQMLVVVCVIAITGAYLLYRLIAARGGKNFMLRAFARILSVFIVLLVLLNVHRGGFFLILVAIAMLFAFGCLLYFWAVRHASGVVAVLTGFWAGLVYLLCTALLLIPGGQSAFFLYERNFHAQFGLLWLPFVLVYTIRHLQVLAEGSRQSFFRVSLWLIIGFLLLAVSGVGHTLFGRQAFWNSTFVHYAGALLFCIFLALHLHENRKKIFFPRGRDVLILLPRRGIFAAACAAGMVLALLPLAQLKGAVAIKPENLTNPRTGLFAASTTQTGVPHSYLSERTAPVGCTAFSGCHALPREEWKTSAHARSANAAYHEAAAILAAEEGKAALRFCAGCHDPVPLLAGEITDAGDYPSPRSEGITCAVCHSIDRATKTADGWRVKVVAEERIKLRHYLTSYMMVKDDKAGHKQTWTPPGIAEAEFCRPCHSLTLNNVAVRDVFREWESGPYGPQGTKPTRCQDCHMPAQGRSYLGNFTPHDHGFPGGNVGFLPERAVAFKAKALRMELARRGPGLEVRLTNTGVGHDFPAGPRDLIEYWFEYRLPAADAQWRKLSENLFPKELLDKSGARLPRHEIWRAFHIRKGKAISPGATGVFQYALAIPGNPAVEVRLMHRRFNAAFLSDTLKKSGMFVGALAVLEARLEKNR